MDNQTTTQSTETSVSDQATLETTHCDNSQCTAQQLPYAVAVVFSRWPLKQMCAFLEDQFGATEDQIGVMRIDRVKGKETNRTIMLVDRALFDKADAKGFTRQQRGLDFKMTEYELREHNFPKEGFTHNFYIPVPAELSADDARSQLQCKLDALVAFGMFSKESPPSLKLPLKSRETVEHRGQAFVTFARETSDNAIALARVLLHDTRLYTSDETYDRMSCFWAREKEQKAPSGPKDHHKTGQMSKSKVQTKKAVPNKKTLVKTTSGATAELKVPAVIKPLAPGENQWTKPLVATPETSETCSAGPCCTTEVCETGVCETENCLTQSCVGADCTPCEFPALNPLEFPTLK